MEGLWRLSGFDTFEGKFYTLPGVYENENSALNAALERLQELEKTQPSSSSCGQGPEGIQDRVYIVRPDGTKYRFLS